MIDRLALYFGCRDTPGHFLQNTTQTIYEPSRAGCPWSLGLMDGGLLNNGRHPDVYDGKVFWTCGGRPVLWLAFVWWDNSVDRRGASNSGFYVRGFEIKERQAALDYAGEQFPRVIARQKFPLALQERP